MSESSTTIPSSNFKFIFDVALANYREHTGVDLSQYPLAEKLQNCQSPDAILEILQEKAKEFEEFRNGNHKLINCLRPVVQVLHVFSGVLDNHVQFQPTNVIFYGVDLLLCTAISVGTSYDTLTELFECVANFIGRLRIYSEIPFEPTMSGLIVRILAEVLSVLSLATKQIRLGRFKKFAKKLLGESEVEAVLQRLDRLTLDEARMTGAQTLQVIHGLLNNMKVVMDNNKASTSYIRQALVTMQEMTIDINRIKRDQLQRDIRNWLYPPDPSTNHNVFCDTHRGRSFAWFTEGSTFKDWKSQGSFLWIHGEPGSGNSALCSSVIQEIKVEYDSGLALNGLLLLRLSRYDKARYPRVSFLPAFAALCEIGFLLRHSLRAIFEEQCWVAAAEQSFAYGMSEEDASTATTADDLYYCGRRRRVS